MSPNGSVLQVPRQEWRGCQHYNARPAGARVTAVVLHADASPDVRSSIAWMQDPRSKVSYHAIVGRTGVVYGLVRPENRAWHAGKSVFRGVADVNDFSVGVCLSNRNDGIEPYTDEALDAAAFYCAQLMRVFPVTLDRFVTHADCATPRGRKTDPGSKFDLSDFLARTQAAYDAGAGLSVYIARPNPEL